MSKDSMSASASLRVEYTYDPESRNWCFVVPSLGIIGGATIGFLAGGIHGQLVHARTDAEMVAERDWLIAVHANQTEIAERAAAVLRESGAERVDLVDGSGTPLPPQAQNPRPADPPSWWWRRAGRG